MKQIACVIHQIAQNQHAIARESSISVLKYFFVFIRLQKCLFFIHYRTSCEAIGEFAEKEGADVYCQDACIKHDSNCPSDRCKCH